MNVKIFITALLWGSISCGYIDKNSKTYGSTKSEQTRLIEPTSSSVGSVSGNKIDICHYGNDSKSNSIVLQLPDMRELESIKAILTYVGLPMNFDIYSSNINNAAAVVVDNRRLILYDPNLLDVVDRRSDTYWTSVSILAHEIGHHLSGHTLKGSVSNQHVAELEADKFSGYVLYKMGASIDQAVKAIHLLGNNHESDTHPNKTKRINAIKAGWLEAYETQYNATLPPKPRELEHLNYAVTEFLPDKLVKPNLSYRDLLNNNGNGSWTSDLWEGVIFSDDGRGNLIIHVTSVGRNEVDGYKEFLNKKIEISVISDLSQTLTNYERGWLKQIMVPGRQITFAFTEEGTQPFRYFSVIKYYPGR